MATPSPFHDPTNDPSIAELIASRPWLKYNAMDGLLLDDVALAGIADAVGTPTWVYSASTMRARYQDFDWRHGGRRSERTGALCREGE